MIKPTIGRIVWFTPSSFNDIRYDKTQPLAAMITYVHSDRCVNLAAHDQHGNLMTGCTSVKLLQEGDEKPAHGFYAEWMPFQVGQAKAAK